MIITDRGMIKLQLYHLSSSLVISNPSAKFAVVFQVRFFDIASQITIENQISNLTEEIRSVLRFESFQVSPVRGIILPKDSQLIKVSTHLANWDQNKNMDRKMKRKNLPHEIKVAQLNLTCSYLLEYNKQRMTKLQQNNGHNFFGAQNIQKIQNHQLNIFIEIQKTTDEIVSSLNNMKISTENHNNHNEQRQQKSKSLIEDFKKHISPINVNTITSSNFLRDLKEKGEVNFQNSKLNEDYNFVKNKLTLSELQRRKSKKLFKNFEKQSVPNFLQSEIKIETPRNQGWDKGFFKNKQDKKIDESIVFENYKPVRKTKSEIKIKNRSIQILVLAVISAIFVSLGSNFKMAFFEQ